MAKKILSQTQTSSSKYWERVRSQYRIAAQWIWENGDTSDVYIRCFDPQNHEGIKAALEKGPQRATRIGAINREGFDGWIVPIDDFHYAEVIYDANVQIFIAYQCDGSAQERIEQLEALRQNRIDRTMR